MDHSHNEETVISKTREAVKKETQKTIAILGDPNHELLFLAAIVKVEDGTQKYVISTSEPSLQKNLSILKEFELWFTQKLGE